jgi:hypothetical protein
LKEKNDVFVRNPFTHLSHQRLRVGDGRGGALPRLGGMATEVPVTDVRDFISLVLSGEAKPFVMDEEGVGLL